MILIKTTAYLKMHNETETIMKSFIKFTSTEDIKFFIKFFFLVNNFKICIFIFSKVNKRKKYNVHL